MEKGYLDTLENVLIYLKSHPEAPEKEVKDLSEPYWTEVRDFLKERQVVLFSGGVTWYSVRTKFIDRCLEDIRIQKRQYTEKKDEEKTKERRSFWRDLLCLVIGAILTVVAQEGWKLLTNKFSDESSDDKTNQSSKHPKEKTSDDRHGVPDSIQLVKDSI